MGPIPPELANMSQLLGLNLRNNQLTGPIPPEMGKFNALNELSPQWQSVDRIDTARTRQHELIETGLYLHDNELSRGDAPGVRQFA